MAGTQRVLETAGYAIALRLAIRALNASWDAQHDIRDVGTRHSFLPSSRYTAPNRLIGKNEHLKTLALLVIANSVTHLGATFIFLP